MVDHKGAEVIVLCLLIRAEGVRSKVVTKNITGNPTFVPLTYIAISLNYISICLHCQAVPNSARGENHCNRFYVFVPMWTHFKRPTNMSKGDCITVGSLD